MSGLRQWVASSDHPLAYAARKTRRVALTFSLPAPALMVRPMLAIYLALRESYYFLVRLLICEPLFKAYCTQYGRGLRTGVYIHWVQGRGKLILGEDVFVDGKCSFLFTVRYTKEPLLRVGDNTVIGHGCSFTVGQQITIGKHCLIAPDVRMFDAPGHPTDPTLRKRGAPANAEDVRPIDIEDNVWIGAQSILYPGVRVGEGSVVATGSVVMNEVPPYTIVAGNPARVTGRLSGAPAQAREVNAGKTAAVADVGGASSLAAVMVILRRVLGTDNLSPTEDFYDAGVTSIMMLPLLMEIEQQLGITFSDGDFPDARTGEQLAARIDALTRISRANESRGSLSEAP